MSRDEVLAAGGVLWRPDGDGGLEVGLVHRLKYDDWSLPKGKLEPGEPAVVAACREVLEETGFRVQVGRTLGRSRYRVVQGGREVPKTVRWWALRATGGAFQTGTEVDQLVWLPPTAARRRLTAGRDVEPLEEFLRTPAATRTLLLVRHASAGDSAQWEGDDDARPLDHRGRAQAEALCTALRLYGPQDLVAAPLVRCLDTLAPLAEATGLPVTTDDAFAERVYADQHEAALQRLRTAVHAGRVTVVCSQGGPLPDVVARLAHGGAAELGRLEARKASLWALSFDASGRLLDADYTADFTS